MGRFCDRDILGGFEPTICRVYMISKESEILPNYYDDDITIGFYNRYTQILGFF